MRKINLKSIECSGCGLLYTVPVNRNDIYEEFKIFKVVRDADKVEVPISIDNPTVLREFTVQEYAQRDADHVVKYTKMLTVIKRKYPKNKFNIVRAVQNNWITHTVKIDPVDAVIETDKKNTKVRCPGCTQIGMEIDGV